jgi:hypothetical protein
MNTNIKKEGADIYVEVTLSGYNGSNRQSFSEREALHLLENKGLSSLTCISGVPLDNRHGPSTGTFHFKPQVGTTLKATKKRKPVKISKKNLDTDIESDVESS